MTAQRAVVAVVSFILLIFVLLQTASQAVAASSFDQALTQAASALDDAASLARQYPKSNVSIPDIELPDERSGVASSPSLNGWLQIELRRIRSEKTGRTQAADLTLLASSLRSVAQSDQSARPPAQDPAAQIASILAQRSYAVTSSGAAPTPQPTLWQRFLEWLGKLVARIVRAVFGATASVPFIGQIVAVTLILLLAALAAYLVYVFVAIVAGRPRRSQVNEGTELAPPLDPEALYDRGLAAAAQGRYAMAIALLFQASLAAFDRRGVLAYDSSLTPGEYRRAVRRTIFAASPAFDTLAQRFVLAAFAEQPVSQSDWTTAQAAYQSLRPLLAS